MEAHPRKLKTVFRSDVRLIVPLFQRPYVWDEEEQWAPLWDDIVAAFDRRSDGETPPHFLGAIVLEQKRGALGSLEVREVIDGQQRLTTLQIVIAALLDTYRAENVKTRLFNLLRKTVDNDPDYVNTPDERFKLWPTNQDRKAYVEVMGGDFRDSTPDPALPRIALAYLFFRAQVEMFLASCTGGDEIEIALDGLTEVMLEHLEMVVIDLGIEDNAQVIFETLNARGTALRASDLIKNALFRTLQDEGKEVESLYTQHWQPLERPHWQKDVRVGRLNRPRLDVFVGFFLVVLLRREVQSHQLFPAARQYMGGDAERAGEFLTELARYAAIYDGLDLMYDGLDSASIPSEVERHILRRLEIVDTQTITPILLWLFAHAAGSERQRALELIEAYLIRRAVCRLTPKNYNRLFLELLRRLGSASDPPDVVVEHFLVGQSAESGIWPTDKQVLDSMRDLPLYRLLKRDRLQRLLLAFEDRMTTSLTESRPVSKKLSVEHLMPQSWQEHWPIKPGEPEEEERRDALVHTIGNLTLITGGLNSSISNGPWDAKRAALLKHSALTVNRNLPTEWTTEAIEARSDALAKLAVSIWRRPDGAPEPSAISDADRDLKPDRDRTSAATTAARSQRSPRTNSTRRDIGQHILNAFIGIDPGEFLTINEIRRVPSEQYPADDLPSPGAISARLFPRSGSPTSVPGVTGAIVNGRRGARKLGA